MTTASEGKEPPRSVFVEMNFQVHIVLAQTTSTHFEYYIRQSLRAIVTLNWLLSVFLIFSLTNKHDDDDDDDCL